MQTVHDSWLNDSHIQMVVTKDYEDNSAGHDSNKCNSSPMSHTVICYSESHYTLQYYSVQTNHGSRMADCCLPKRRQTSFIILHHIFTFFITYFSEAKDKCHMQKILQVQLIWSWLQRHNIQQSLNSSENKTLVGIQGSSFSKVLVVNKSQRLEIVSKYF